MKKQRVVPALDENCLSPESQVQVNHLQVFAEETLEENTQLREENARLKDELAILKGEKKRPVFKPSRMNSPISAINISLPSIAACPRAG